jgi:Host cell surface-exposed lipoprotein
MLVFLTLAFFIALFGVFKPFKGFKRKHFGIAAAILFVSCIIMTPTPDEIKTSSSSQQSESNVSSSAERKSNKRALPVKALAIEEEGESAKISTDEVKAQIEEKESLTGPQRNAVRSAEQYLNMTGFSRKGLIEQLSSDAGDGYSVKDATVAVDSLDVDWNENALKSAKQYLDMTGFSCKGLIEQLSSSAGSGYTSSEAKYGAREAGAC